MGLGERWVTLKISRSGKKPKIKTFKRKKVTAYLSIHKDTEEAGCLVLLQVRIVNYMPISQNLGQEPDFFASILPGSITGPENRFKSILCLLAVSYSFQENS